MKRLFFIVFLLYTSLYFYATSSVTATFDEPVAILSNQTRDDLRLSLKETLLSANKTIDIWIYSLADRKMIDLVNKKGQEGIKVRVRVDAAASKLAMKLLSFPVEVEFREGAGLMHKKIVVVDQEKVWMGSCNFTRESLTAHANLVTVLHSPELAKKIVARDEPTQWQGMIGGVLCEFVTTPALNEKKIISLIQEAKKSIKVAMYTFTRYDFAEALIAAKGRGVNVQVALDRSASHGASKKMAQKLKRAGVPVMVNLDSNLLHHKCLIIDGSTLVHGSLNWTKAAFTQNEDCFMIMHNLGPREQTKLENLWETIHFESIELKMKIALVGFGKMGREVKVCAEASGHEIVAILDTHQEGGKLHAKKLQQADVCIDFTSPESVVSNVAAISALGKNMVIGTTGWYDQLDEVKKIVNASNVGLIYSPNFSIGVHVFMKLIEEAALLFNPFKQYDVASFECHHTEKKDSPSGTAKAISDLLAKKMARKRGQIEFASLRVGAVAGKHEVIFDAKEDQIVLTHEAKGRVGFAKGSLRAAEWIVGKKGIYNMEDFICAELTQL